MRLTIIRKIVLGVAIIVILAALSMWVLYGGLASVRQALVRLAEVHEPVSAAGHEMEINVHEMTLAVLGYLSMPDSAHRELFESDARDFESFSRKYRQLAETDEEQALGRRAEWLYQQLQTTGRSLLAERDKQESLLSANLKAVEEIDDLIDHQLQAEIDADDPDRLAKLEAINSLETDLAEVNLWLVHYMRTHQAEHQRRIAESEAEVRENLRRVQELNLTRHERSRVDAVEMAIETMMARQLKVLALEEKLRAGSEQLVGLRTALDQVLDEEMQALALKELGRPRREADAAVSHALANVRWLAIVFLLAALGVTLVLVRTVTWSLARLRSATESIARGDFDFRIAVAGQDEFADLAVAFNKMVAQLQATTVSKLALEASDRQLRQEIAQRQRSQEEQARLQASLRRAETWSALGTLLAGVIHQVRNPLFAISSIVDAMQARFGEREEYRRYMGHLREQVTRITGLLEELMEYGKPPSQDRAGVPVGEVIQDAIRACRPLAQRLGVQLVSPPAAGSEIAADRARLVRALECLVENALQHSSPGGVVRVEVLKSEHDTPWVQCTVSDQGPGFALEDLPHVFEPFFTRRSGGTGLGLAIAHNIVVDHAGEIVAANGPAGGAVVTVRLPQM